MERRKFFGLAPFGLLGIAAIAKGETTEPTGSVMKKALHLTIQGPDGKQYHPLVVEQSDETYAEVPLSSDNRLRIDASTGNAGACTIYGWGEETSYSTVGTERLRVTHDGRYITPSDL